MKAARLPKDPGPAGWDYLLERPAPAHVLDTRLTADVLVIGAGFAGLAAARQLALFDPQARITLLEAARVGAGPAGRNSGFMIDLPHDLSSANYGGGLDEDRQTIRENRRAIAFAADMVRDLGLPDEAFQAVGKLNGAATAKGNRHNLDYTKHLKAMGEDHALLDAKEMREITGSQYYRSGVFTPGTAMLQPAMFVRGIAQGLISNRIELFEESPVISLERDGDGDGDWVAQTPKGQITAPKVILAINGHLQSFGFYPKHLVHVFTYASMTGALSADDVANLGGEPRWGLTPSDPMGTTVRRISGLGGDRLIIRNRFTYDPTMEVDEARLKPVWDGHDQAFRARFPGLSHVRMEHRWGGRLCLSRNGVQVVRELDDGLYSACVQNGLGTTRGTLAGMLAAEMAMGETSEALERAQAARAPTALPPEPFAKLGARATLRWQEWRAGKEI